VRNTRLFASIPLLAIALFAVAGGCKNNNNGAGNMSARGSALDVSSPAPMTAAPAPQAYTPSPAPTPVAVQPVVYDSAPAPQAAATPAVANTSAGSYTVRHGDTLYSIAKSHYGSGKEYTRIVSANPGLSPEKLRAGQKIVIP
jgi:nucleoid-associated protein YgaU